MAVRNPSFADPNSLAALQQQYQAALNQNNSNHLYAGDWRDDRQALNNARDRLNAATTAAAAAKPANDPVADAQKKILDYTAGRGDATLNDAMVNQALQRLNSVSAGADAPFTQEVQNQQLAAQAGMNAEAAGAQGEQLRMQAAGLGGSIADPSYQAKLRQINSQRQSANANAQGQIQTNAQLQNFGARQTATNSLLNGRMGQLGMANSQYNQAAGYLNQTTQDQGHQSAVSPVVYNFGGQNPGAGVNYQTPPIEYSTTKPAPAQGQSPASQAQTVAQQAQQPVAHTDNGGYFTPGAPTASVTKPTTYQAGTFNATMPQPTATQYTQQLFNQLMPSFMYKFS